MSAGRNEKNSGNDGFFRNHPVISNVVVIMLVAFLGIWIVYLSLQLFTKHGASNTVPGVENMTYTQAIQELHKHGFRVDIRDSVYNEEVKPGYVIEQFPKSGSTVKPGRKIFLYINAVSPKEVVVDPDNNPTEDALKGYSMRQGRSRLEELGFKNIQIVHVLGDNDRVLKITANGKTVRKLQKVPVNARIVMEVCDGRLNELRDSLELQEYVTNYEESHSYAEESGYDGYYDYGSEDDEEPMFVQ